MNKFYGAKRFCLGIVAAHESGKPMNPKGCRGNGFIYTYHDTDEVYTGKLGIHGHVIQANSAQTFCASVNKVLDDGGSVQASRALPLGSVIKCRIESLGDGTKKVAEPEIAFQHQTEYNKEPDEPTVEESTIEEPEESSEEAEEPVNETEETVETSLEAKLADSPDFEYAESLTKKELDKYAEGFGVKLHGNSSKEKMMSDFRDGMSQEPVDD